MEPSRPYRSHKSPACNACRRRKARCRMTEAGQPCQLCKERGFECRFDGPSYDKLFSRSDTNPRNHSTIVPDLASPTDVKENTVVPYIEESPLIVGPAVAEDFRIVSKHVADGDNTAQHVNAPQNSVLGQESGSILYHSVPRKRRGFRLEKDPGSAQREILEQILGPMKENVMQLYRDYIHPSFPAVDGAVLSHAPTTHASSSLLCQIYALSLNYWNQDKTLRKHPRPDINYFWNLSLAALQDDFLAPNLSTIQAALVDLVGRPVGFILGNIAMTGSTIALAHALGLNRNPDDRFITQHQKNVRIRMFWSLLIHDRWSSFAYGTPPTVFKNQYDVPLPTLETVCDPEEQSIDVRQAALGFVKLCQLTEILGDALPMVYNLDFGKNNIGSIKQIGDRLYSWSDSLPDFLKMKNINMQISAPGAVSLLFCYLAVQTLISRLDFQKGDFPDDDKSIETRLDVLRRKAGDMQSYLMNLEGDRLNGFWLPYVSPLLANGTTMLLRCIVEIKDQRAAYESRNKVLSFQKWLHEARDKHAWDLADICIKRCDHAITKLCTNQLAIKQNDPLRDGENVVYGTQGIDALPSESGAFLDNGLPWDLGWDMNLDWETSDLPWEQFWNSLDGPS